MSGMGSEMVNSTTTAAADLGVALGIPASISLWVIVPAVFVLWVLVLSLIKKITFVIVRKFAARTKTHLDDIFFDALDLPLQLMIYATGILVVKNFIPVNGAVIDQYLLAGFKITGIIAGVLFIEKFLSGLVALYAQKVEILKTAGGIAQGVIRVVVMGLGGLVVLDSMGISITPIIASLGIGSLAVALALQPTLENFFSGIQLIADKPIQIGQFIKLDTGEEGTVTRIGWRSTWICLPNNNTVVIPNKLLVNSRVTNFFYPDAELAVTVAVGAHYSSDLEKVEKVTLEVARAVQKSVVGAVPGADPVLRYQGFGDSSVNFNVILRAADFSSAVLLKHEFIKRLHRRYAEEGIIIPYPTRVVIKEN
jgi:small-conductance mechanosensitive channel